MATKRHKVFFCEIQNFKAKVFLFEKYKYERKIYSYSFVEKYRQNFNLNDGTDILLILTFIEFRNTSRNSFRINLKLLTVDAFVQIHS